MFVYNTAATELLQRLEFVQKMDAPLEGSWLQAKHFILLSIPASASVSEQVSDWQSISQDMATPITTPTHQPQHFSE